MLFDHELRNVPGKSVVGVVLEGEMLSGTDDNEPKTYMPGETFVVQPGSHHTVSENNSETSSAKALAFFVLDTAVLEAGGHGALTTFD